MFNVLVAEDDLHTRKYIGKLLQNNGKYKKYFRECINGSSISFVC